jgi:hypothetical protein
MLFFILFQVSENRKEAMKTQRESSICEKVFFKIPTELCKHVETSQIAKQHSNSSSVPSAKF